MATTNFQSHYIPNTPAEQDELLAAIGLRSVDDLFADIPDGFRNPPLELPAPLSELEIQRELGEMAARNRPLSAGPSFLGAGSYHHFIPSIVKAIMTRGEFLTAYTPYQPEVSQGTLQVIFEFQTMISALYGMEVANAGMYDGATSLAEAVLMACRVTRRQQVIVADTVAPAYRQVIATYCQAQGIAINVAPADQAAGAATEATAGIVVQYPNFYGSRWTTWRPWARRLTPTARCWWYPRTRWPWGCCVLRASSARTSLPARASPSGYRRPSAGRTWGCSAASSSTSARCPAAW